MEDELTETLKKVAQGFSMEEVTEEYAVEDGEDRLLKRKVTKKDVPPDLKAVKMLLDGEVKDVTSLSDEQLLQERKRLLRQLEEMQK